MVGENCKIAACKHKYEMTDTEETDEQLTIKRQLFFVWAAVSFDVGAHDDKSVAPGI
jgi:hypothetical protein